MSTHKITAVLIGVLPLVVSVIALGISALSLKTSMEQNKIADKGVKIAEADSNFNRLAQGKEMADKVYDCINQYPNIIEGLRTNSAIQNIRSVDPIVDCFEDLGDSFCRQVIDRETVREKFYYTLNYACNNNQVYSYYGGFKNGTSLLCYEFFPESKLAGKAVNKSACPALTH